MMLLVALLAQVVPPVSHGSNERNTVPPNVRCVQDSFGNYSCSDGTRMIRDSFGNVTVIPGRR
jgi:hypothetical protein